MRRNARAAGRSGLPHRPPQDFSNPTEQPDTSRVSPSERRRGLASGGHFHGGDLRAGCGSWDGRRGWGGVVSPIKRDTRGTHPRQNATTSPCRGAIPAVGDHPPTETRRCPVVEAACRRRRPPGRRNSEGMPGELSQIGGDTSSQQRRRAGPAGVTPIPKPLATPHTALSPAPTPPHRAAASPAAPPRLPTTSAAPHRRSAANTPYRR